MVWGLCIKMTDLKKYKYKSKIKSLEKEIRDNVKYLDRLNHEQLFSKKVLDSLPGIFYLYDEKGTLIRWNKNHEIISGYSGKELRRMGIYDWFSPSDKQKVQDTVDRILKEGKKRDVEAGLIIKNGSSIPYYFTGVRMTVDGRRYLLGVGTDVVELKKAESLLKKSEEKYRNIVENAVEGIYQSTPEGEMISANHSMATILGYPSVQDLTDSITTLAEDVYVSGSERKKFVELMEKSGSISGFEVQFFKKDKSIIWVSLHARPVFDSRGELTLIEGMILDITEKRKERESLEKSEALLREENLRLRRNFKDRYRFAEIVGKSPGMQEVYDLILKAAATDANAIIYGESGTGKEIVAKAIHTLSKRNKGTFIPVNCGAIPESLIESEFFGYKKGAFTGAVSDKEGLFDLAEGGTLFLDELGEIPQNLQVKLLRVIEGGGYTPVGGKKIKKPSVRIVAATNQDLKHYVAKGKMREDFFYRIHIIPITLPPLRKRKEDIPLLTEHFLREMADGDEITALSGEMMAALFNHSWPGNVRELQNVLQRYIAMGKFSLFDETDREIKSYNQPASVPLINDGGSYAESMDAYEKRLLVHTLESCHWNREKAASHLGIPIRTFYRKMKKYCLKRQDMPNMA